MEKPLHLNAFFNIDCMICNDPWKESGMELKHFPTTLTIRSFLYPNQTEFESPERRPFLAKVILILIDVCQVSMPVD